MKHHTPFFHKIEPDDTSSKSLLYYENQNANHYGGLFNSFYPHNLETLLGANRFTLQGSFPPLSSLKIWLHSIEKQPQILTSVSGSSLNSTINIPSFPIQKGQRLTVEVQRKQNDKTPIQFSWGIPKPKQSPKHVKLAIIICTYLNDSLVTQNVQKLTKSPLWAILPADLIVINNGGQEAPLELPYERVTQYKQKNCGGSGGFYKGIEEAFLPSKDYTHVLLMDDDIEFHPEIIQRTLKFHQYSRQDAVYGASMLKLEDPEFLHEAGANYRTKHSIGSYSPVKPGLLTSRKISELGISQKVHYNGWWYCSFSRKAVETSGMPLKIFIHSDDEEYALRLNHNGFPSYCLGGLSVWHASFENKHPTWIRYFDFRNNIIRLLTQQGEMKNSRKVAPMQLKRVVRRALIRNDYGAAMMAIEAYKDLTKNNFTWEIDCYDTKIAELKALYQSFMPSNHQVSGRYRFHGKKRPQRWWKRPISWLRYASTNLIFVPLPSIRIYVTTTPNYSWWDVPCFSDVIVESEGRTITYPRSLKLIQRINNELSRLTKI